MLNGRRKLLLALLTELEHNVVQDIPHRLCFVGSGVFDGPGRVDDLATEPDVGVCSQLGLVQRFRDEPHPLHSSAAFVYCGDWFFCWRRGGLWQFDNTARAPNDPTTRNEKARLA